MEADLRSSPDLGYLIDNDDANNVRLSTIMVATIQEVKDRISQIEYIFCAQLFPELNSRPKKLLKRFTEVMKAAEDVWRKKEAQFLMQIEELQPEKNDAPEENKKLVALLEEKAKSMSAAEDDWKKKEALLRFEIEGVRNQKQKVLEENEVLVASLEKEKSMSLQNEQLLNECRAEKKLLVDKLESLQKNEEVAELQSQLTQKAGEVAAEKQIQENLLQQIEMKDTEIVTEKKKRRDLIDMYKRLKSQYNFLCNKFGLNTESSLPNNRIEDESIMSEKQQTPKATRGRTDENQQTFRTTSKMNGQKEDRSLEENLEDSKVSRLIENSGSHSKIKLPSPSSSLRAKFPVSVKSEPLAGTKRPAPHWRDTRGPREAGGADPHDDFLDTPLEIVKGKLNKSIKEEVHDFPVPPPKDMDFNSSDDETQDLNVDPVPQKQQISVIKTGDKSFKYVEPVRKKADRDNLKGFECKQCKKFYDAVLPDNGKNGENKNTNFRCEHHDGVSRHRYRYVPPLTPEGFWNIGFESEM